MLTEIQQPLPANPETAPGPGGSPGELDLFAFFLLLWAHRLRIVLCAIVAFLLMVAYTLMVKPRFSAQASIIIPQQNSSAAGLALQAAAGVDLVGGGNEIYLDILKSRTILDRIIANHGLNQRYKVKGLARAEIVLASRTALTSSKEGLLQVTVEDEDPKIAAALANSYIAELDKENQTLAITSAAQQRRYYEQEMIKEKNALADAEVVLKQSEENSGVLEPAMQVQAHLTATETTRAQLRARQVQLGALLQSETPENPEVIRVKAEVASLETQLQAMQSQGGPEAGMPAARAPADVLAYVRNAREVKFHEALFELLSKQFETAKEQEARNISMIEVLDTATPPEFKSWPPRTLYCLGAFAFGGIVGVAYTVLDKIVRAILSNPRNQARYRSLTKTAASAPENSQ